MDTSKPLGVSCRYERLLNTFKPILEVHDSHFITARGARVGKACDLGHQQWQRRCERAAAGEIFFNT